MRAILWEGVLVKIDKIILCATTCRSERSESPSEVVDSAEKVSSLQ